MSNQELSKNLKKLRDKKGFSQDRLAKLADVANNTVIKIEQGENKNPTLETLKKLANALGVSLDDLIK
jgi:transcriptional regulator with XRE-family HTH domain